MSQSVHPPLNNRSNAILRLANRALVVTVWVSAILFGLYILAFYAASLINGNMNKWNKLLPGIYTPGARTATLSIGVHFAAGGIILVMGCIQVIRKIREIYPRLHRWVGRIYVVASILAAIGGLLFILIKGTVGGTVMDIGFALYGILMFWCAIETIRQARARNLQKHRIWALRLFALAIGSWLYRMEYGFWFLLTDKAGHTNDFHGWFDNIMAFFFYLPNLILVELMVRSDSRSSSAQFKIFTSVILFMATTFIAMGTFFFVTHLWGPAIVGMFK